jgi:hypothetical protein
MLERVVAGDSEMVVWWGTPVECASAVHRLRREGRFSSQEAALLRLGPLEDEVRRQDRADCLEVVAAHEPPELLNYFDSATTRDGRQTLGVREVLYP